MICVGSIGSLIASEKFNRIISASRSTLYWSSSGGVVSSMMFVACTELVLLQYPLPAMSTKEYSVKLMKVSIKLFPS